MARNLLPTSQVSTLFSSAFCPLCQKQLNISRYLCRLPCGHEFCAACVRGMVSGNGVLTCICFSEPKKPLSTIRHAPIGHHLPYPRRPFFDNLRPIKATPSIARQDLIKSQALLAPSAGALFYFDFSLDDVPMGSILIRTFKCTPLMSLNFKFLVEGGRRTGYRGYRGCKVLQAWRHESLILGDVELNNGTGGRAAVCGGRFQPDCQRVHHTRGLVGMRRHVNDGLVASQFRIMLRAPCLVFTGWFGRVEWGLDFLDKLSETGDHGGNPTRRIIVSDCGQLE